MTSESLVFPDTGDDFLRCLKTAVLYSPAVWVLTEFAFDTAESMGAELDQGFDVGDVLKSWCDVEFSDTFLVDRISRYYRFLRESKSELMAALEAGAVKSAFHGVESERPSELIVTQLIRNHYAVGRYLAPDGTLDGDRLGKYYDISAEVIDQCPPSLFDRMMYWECLRKRNPLAAVFTEMSDKHRLRYRSILECQRPVTTVAASEYWPLVASVSEACQAVLCTWDSRFERAAWRARALLAADSRGSGRPAIEGKLGQIAIQRHLPCPERLPMAEIISMRTKRRAELDHFRSAVASLSTQVDLEQPAEKIAVEVENLAIGVIDPAVQQLTAALDNVKLSSLQQVGRSWMSASAGTVPAILSYIAGAPLELSSILGIAGATAGSIIDGVLERKKISRASQWSFLFNLRRHK